MERAHPLHHPGFLDWETYLDNQARIGGNIHPRPHAAGGAVREGAALLQGIAACGQCGRRLLVAYTGRGSSPTYYCRAGGGILDGRGTRCLSVGGRQIERAITQAFLAALTPAGMEAAILAAEQLEGDFDAALRSWRLAAERARYEAARAERHYRAVDPDNRLVARSLEAAWEAALADLAKAEAELAERERRRPRTLSDREREALAAFGDDLGRVWDAPTTSDRERKELLHTLVEEVLITPDAGKKTAHLVMRWRGGATTELECDLAHPRQPPNKTAEATIDLLRRLAVHYSDAQIAGILNRQGRRSASGERFTAVIVGGLRRYRGIATHTADPDVEPQGELATVQKAAKILGVAPSTLHRWLNDGFVAGKQLTPGAPWRIRVSEELRAKFAEEAPPGWVPMLEATHALRVSRQTVLHRVQRGELRAMHVRSGRRKGLRIELPRPAESLMASLFEGSHELGG